MSFPTPLSKKLREALGPDAGEDLVTWLQEMRAEHDEKLASIRADFAELRHEIQASESRVVERIHKLEVTLGDRIHGVDERVGRVEVRVAEVKADLMKWSFVFWVGAVTAIAALAGVLRN
jgi:chromosome segregation ATPase